MVAELRICPRSSFTRAQCWVASCYAGSLYIGANVQIQFHQNVPTQFYSQNFGLHVVVIDGPIVNPGQPLDFLAPPSVPFFPLSVPFLSRNSAELLCLMPACPPAQSVPLEFHYRNPSPLRLFGSTTPVDGNYR